MKKSRRNLLELPAESRRKNAVESNNWWDRQHSLVLRQTPRWAQSLTLALVLLGGGAIIASSIIKIDEVITVTGTLKPAAGIYEVKTPAGGLIKEVFVKEGQKVSKGDLLVKFDTRRAEQEIENLNKQIEEINKSKTSIERTLASKLKSMNNSLKTNRKILERMKGLQGIGAVEENSLLRQEDQVFQYEIRLEEIKEELIQRQSDAERSLSDLRSRLKNNEIQKQYELVTAQKDGVIFENNAREGGVLSGGQLIMKIVPQNRLKGSVAVTNREIGFIKLNQKAQIRVDSFDYTRFGIVDGFVKSIGAEVRTKVNDGNTEYTFPVVLGLEKNYLETKGVKIGLQSGMSITANLKLREKRLISVVSDLFNYNYDALTRLRQ